MRAAILVLALFGASVCAYPKAQGSQEHHEFKRLYVDPVKFHQGSVSPRIIGGTEAVPHSIPYQVYLEFADLFGSGWLCGGSLISENYVLTAGHCTNGAVSASVLLGAHNITDSSESSQLRLKSSSLKTHEKFDMDTISYDIGVIKLSEPVKLTSSIQLSQLPSRADEDLDLEGDEARVSGWGLTDGLGTNVSPILMEVNSTVISNKECNDVFEIVQDYQVCISGKDGHGSCNGDSGGPLIVNNKQVGVVSYGVRNCVSGYPSAFTRTSKFLDWIEENTDVKIE